MDTNLILFLVVVIVIVVILFLWYQARQTPQAKQEHHEHPAAPPADLPAEPAAPAAVAEAVVETPLIAVEPVTAADDLKIVEGIGPKIETLLNNAGIRTFAQLAASDPDQIKQVLLASGLRLGDPTTWPEQARLAAEGKTDELQTLQDQLNGGRLG